MNLLLKCGLIVIGLISILSISITFTDSASAAGLVTPATNGGGGGGETLKKQGVNVLKKIADECKNLDDWRDGSCDSYQAILEDELECGDGRMFKSANIKTDSRDESVTEKKWFVDPNKYSECLKAAVGYVDAISQEPPGPNCSSMKHTPEGGDSDSPSWKECEKLQNKLFSSLGCSKRMFKPLEGQDGYYTFDPGPVGLCQTENIKAASSLTLIGPDGQKATFNEDGGIDKVTDRSGNDITDKTISPSSSNASGVTCQGGAMGWLFCPMINAMASAVQESAKLIDKLMTVRFLATEGPSNDIRKAWGSFLGLANILLIVAFLVIIFSQATSAGLSNYNVKRMLPRLVVAAILMNISFYICALFIDFSNIVGASIMGFLLGGGSVSDSIVQATGGGGPFIAGKIVAIAALIALAFFLFVPLVLSIITILIVLIGRQVVLMCLVLVSPLAFVAWLLPNTEKWFKKWLELFGQLLIVYPAVMLMFGASLYLAKLLNGGATSIVGGGDDTQEVLQHIIALVVLCVPLFALPGLLKGSSSMLAKIGGAADRATRGINLDKGLDKVRGGAMGAGKRLPGVRSGFEMGQDWKQGRERRREQGILRRRNDRLTGRGRFGRVGQKIGLSAAGGFTQEGRTSALGSGVAGYQKDQSEVAQTVELLLNGSRAAAEAAVRGKGAVDHDGNALVGSDLQSYRQFEMAGGVKTLAGARAAATVLGKTGGLNASVITDLSKEGVHSQADGAEFAEHVNEVARNAGMDYLAENTADDRGKIVLGGQRDATGGIGSVLTEIQGKGYGGLARQSFEDDSVLYNDPRTGANISAQQVIGEQLAKDLTDPVKSKSTLRELAKMDNRKISAAAIALHKANPGMFAHRDDAISYLAAQRDTARKDNPGI